MFKGVIGMGATLVGNDKDKLLLKKNDVKCANCSAGQMIPFKTVYEKKYQDIILQIHGIRAFQCQNQDCSEVIYSASSMLKAIREAKKNYDNFGIMEFHYSDE